jgi:hypothetical protein
MHDLLLALELLGHSG